VLDKLKIVVSKYNHIILSASGTQIKDKVKREFFAALKEL
jgi:hypothetical protein